MFAWRSGSSLEKRLPMWWEIIAQEMSDLRRIMASLRARTATMAARMRDPSRRDRSMDNVMSARSSDSRLERVRCGRRFLVRNCCGDARDRMK